MPNTQLALAADDRPLAGLIGDRLHTQLGTHPRLLPFDAVRDSLGPHFSGLLVCAANSAADSERVVRLVRDIHRWQWPSTILLVEAAEASRHQTLTCLDPYVACRLHW